MSSLGSWRGKVAKRATAEHRVIDGSSEQLLFTHLRYGGQKGHYVSSG